MAAENIQPFHQHIQELRRRLMVVALVLSMGAIVGYIFRSQLIKWFSAPLHQSLYYTSPSGALQFTVQICMLTGVVLALPVVVYELVRFIQPALKHHTNTPKISRFKILKFIVSSYILALIGTAFAYWFVLPTALHFFAGFGTPEVKSFITADKYFSFVANCIAVFAAIFQLPVIMLFINRIRPIPPKTLRKYRKWVIVGSFLLALVLPFSYDPISQFLMAVPLIVLYELSIILISAANKRRKLVAKLSKKSKKSSLVKERTPLKQQPAPEFVSLKPVISTQYVYTEAAPEEVEQSVKPQRSQVKDWQFVYSSRPAPNPIRRWPDKQTLDGLNVNDKLLDDLIAL